MEPISELNQVIVDISMAYPNYSPQARRMNQQVQNIYDNYTIDLSYGIAVRNIITDISDNLLSQVERDLNFKKKQMDIQEYYTKDYQQQIFLLKLLIFFSLIALFGCFLFNSQLISIQLLALYLGFVASIGFIVVFYYLWDFFLRDNTIFDEYNFLTYVAPHKPSMNQTSDFNDNIIYC
jgi:hypothetical protein